MTSLKKITAGTIAVVSSFAFFGTASASSFHLENRLTGPHSRNENIVRVNFDRDWDHDWNRDWDWKRNYKNRHHRFNDDFRFRNRTSINQNVRINANTGHNVQRDNTIAGDIRTGDISIDTSLRN